MIKFRICFNSAMLLHAIIICVIAWTVVGNPHILSIAKRSASRAQALAERPHSIANIERVRRGSQVVPVPVGIKWQNRAWCGSGGKCHTQAIPKGAKLVNVDLFGTPENEIKELGKNYIVTCYFSAGTFETWRPDASKFSSSTKGLKMLHWDETWLDIRRLDELKPIMRARMELAKKKGCHGVEPDNIDCWQNQCVRGVKAGDKGMYGLQLKYNRWMAQTAHQLGLNIGHKNNLDQVKDLANDFDWAMNESCHAYNECKMSMPFIERGKAVLATEYKGSKSKTCQGARTLRLSQKVDNGGRWEDC